MDLLAGTYDIYFDLNNSKVYVMAEGLTPGQTPGPEEPEFEAQASECGKMLTPWKESYEQPRQHIKKQRHYFANKRPSS